MKNSIKITIIVAAFIISIALLLIFIRPVLLDSNNMLSRISEEREENARLNSEIESYLSSKDNYYILNAEYQKLSMELPRESDLTLLTNEFYEIAKYTSTSIRTLNYTEIITKAEEGEKENPFKEIKIDLLSSGSYYEILNFINTIESMPRLVKIENVLIQSTGDNYEDLLCYITAKTYFEKVDEKNES